MKSHMVGQPGHYLLWISIAGILDGKPEHFKHNYLAALISGFHVPVMEFPLRNRKEILKLGGLDFENKNRQSSVGQQMNTNPSYVLHNVRHPVPGNPAKDLRR